MLTEEQSATLEKHFKIMLDPSKAFVERYPSAFLLMNIINGKETGWDAEAAHSAKVILGHNKAADHLIQYLGRLYTTACQTNRAPTSMSPTERIHLYWVKYCVVDIIKNIAKGDKFFQKSLAENYDGALLPLLLNMLTSEEHMDMDMPMSINIAAAIFNNINLCTENARKLHLLRGLERILPLILTAFFPRINEPQNPEEKQHAIMAMEASLMTCLYILHLFQPYPHAKPGLYWEQQDRNTILPSLEIDIKNAFANCHEFFANEVLATVFQNPENYDPGRISTHVGFFNIVIMLDSRNPFAIYDRIKWITDALMTPRGTENKTLFAVYAEIKKSEKALNNIPEEKKQSVVIDNLFTRLYERMLKLKELSQNEIQHSHSGDPARAETIKRFMQLLRVLEHKCGNQQCQKECNNACTHCLTTVYCGVDCQKADFAGHMTSVPGIKPSPANTNHSHGAGQ